MLCETCGYSANRQVASFTKPEAAIEDQRALQKVATPECKSIEALAEFLGVPRSRTAKAVFLIADLAEETPAGRGENPAEAAQAFVFAIVRGDMEVNETKLANLVKTRAQRPATEEEIQVVGAVPGYASPVGLSATSGKRDALPERIIVDDLVTRSPNLVAGANEAGYHLLNVNYGRDYTAHLVADIAAAQEGDACPQCGSPLHAVRGVEVGNIFQLGTRYSQALGAEFLAGTANRPVIVGSYSIGTGNAALHRRTIS
jgi:prolyl-tRNA synthetase